MLLTMTNEEREAFLADVHVAVISVAEDGHGPLARRYLGTEVGDSYLESTRDVVGNVLIRMRPERWLTVDYAKHPRHRE